MPSSWYYVTMEFQRELDLSKYQSSVLLLGPRMTGKSYLLNKYSDAKFFNLLDPDLEIQFKSNPKKFYEEISGLEKGQLVIVDEIQRIPQLLDYVQIGIEKHGIRFILSGSSARKLKRTGANLLAARALLFYLHPLSVSELQNIVDIQKLLHYGSLPKVVDLLISGSVHEVRKLLMTYRAVYLQEEIKQEAITRNLGNFTRFLDIAAQYNSQQVVYQNIATAAQIPRSTVSNYFDILEDTLIAKRLWEYQKSEKDKNKAKLYFFDLGVVRAIQNRLQDPPTNAELGHLFENFIFNELQKIKDYFDKPHNFSYWNEGEEIDFLIEKNGEILLAIECKSANFKSPIKFNKFRKRFPKVPIIIVSLIEERERKLDDNILVRHWSKVLDEYREL